jgi:hypothetical protein
VREPIRRKVDLSSVQDAAGRNAAVLASYREALDDARRPERLQAAQCRLCFYARGRVGGASTTSALCGLCDAETRFVSTCVDALCLGCALARKLCRHCGSDVDDRQRRKL